LGPRFRLGLPISNSTLAVCAAGRVTCFPFDFDFVGLAFCTSLSKGMGEGVNGYRSDVDELDARLGAVVNEGAGVWR